MATVPRSSHDARAPHRRAGPQVAASIAAGLGDAYCGMAVAQAV
ncbi:hypothetical protein ABZ801_11095 [Actinomadura sp. NPDC047616]